MYNESFLTMTRAYEALNQRNHICGEWGVNYVSWQQTIFQNHCHIYLLQCRQKALSRRRVLQLDITVLGCLIPHNIDSSCG